MKKLFSFLFLFYPLIIFSQEESTVGKINKSINGAISDFVYEWVVPIIFYSFKIGETSIPLVLIWLKKLLRSRIILN